MEECIRTPVWSPHLVSWCLYLAFCVYSKKKIQQRTDSSVEERFGAKSSSDSVSRYIFFPLSYCNVVRRTVRELWTALPRRSSMAWMPRLRRSELGMWWLAWPPGRPCS